MRTTLALALLVPGTALGTTIVVSWSAAGEIVMAADSKVLREGNVTGETSLVECKIFHSGDVFFATTGITVYSPTDFYLDELAARVGNFRRLDDGVDAFEREARVAITALLDHARRAPLEGFKAEAVFGKFEHGHPVVILKSFHVERGELRESRERRPDGTPTAAGVFILGENKAALEFLATAPRGWVRSVGFAEASRRLVEVEIEARPETVGGPVAVLSLGAAGASWQQRGACGQ